MCALPYVTALGFVEFRVPLQEKKVQIASAVCLWRGTVERQCPLFLLSRLAAILVVRSVGRPARPHPGSVMAGLIAAGVAAGWSPVGREQEAGDGAWMRPRRSSDRPDDQNSSEAAKKE